MKPFQFKLSPLWWSHIAINLLSLLADLVDAYSDSSYISFLNLTFDILSGVYKVLWCPNRRGLKFPECCRFHFASTFRFHRDLSLMNRIERNEIDNFEKLLTPTIITSTSGALWFSVVCWWSTVCRCRLVFSSSTIDSVRTLLLFSFLSGFLRYEIDTQKAPRSVLLHHFSWFLQLFLLLFRVSAVIYPPTSFFTSLKSRSIKRRGNALTLLYSPRFNRDTAMAHWPFIVCGLTLGSRF